VRLAATALALGLAIASVNAKAKDAGGLSPFVVVNDAVPAALGGLKGDPDRGRQIALDRRRGNCLICHAIPETGEPFPGEIGPSLAGVAARFSEGQIRLRLVDQSRLNPKTVMPSYYRIAGFTDVAPEYRGKPVLDTQEIEDLVAYLETLGK